MSVVQRIFERVNIRGAAGTIDGGMHLGTFR
jgi:hypothetical protein